MMSLTPHEVAEYLQARRLSVWSVAIRMEVDPGHLRRVLAGQREGSQALLERALETAAAMRPRRRDPSKEETDRLIEAAAHMFFLKRGDFESAVFAEANEVGLYGPGPIKKRAYIPPKRKEEPCQP
jgi:hypothetical protein